ncbi:type VII secretion protein EccB [Nonomuraea dietziae]|uniref:Type VII secretion protein EccB n=1 Tax=Nonomuraea dietziae TaxID=65515 RepID=A0A7W5Y8F4_9ACTN|nr:type VII secretion protein EccB [Nonomuraea dietziae]MBB3728418.1 type VII secretion protein EccB [Nonomuraea dietziae]
MQTRKDLYQAHRLMLQRMGMALLQAEPDVAESPMRRQNVAMFCGLLIAVLVVAGFGVWGLIKPGNATNLTDPGQLLVEENTGAAFVYSQEQRKLLPVANYVSGRLLLDSTDVRVRNVTSASLAKFDRGPTVGIPGLPDSLPPKEKLVKGPWSACVMDNTNPSSVRKQFVSLVGGIDVGGRPLGGDAIVVVDARRNAYVILNDTKMRVQPEGVLALGAGSPRQVPAAWLNAIPEGPDFRAPRVPGLGKRTRGPDGKSARLGQIFTTPGIAGGPTRWYVLVADGLAPITSTQANLALSDPKIKAVYGNRPAEPIEIDAATANSKQTTTQKHLMGGGLPASMPRVIAVPGTSPLCSVYAETAKGSVKAKLTIGSTITIQPPAVTGSEQFFDQVILPAGGAALAGLLPGENQLKAINTYELITDQGRRFPLHSADQVGKLGYDAADVTPVPTHLLHSIQPGPTLDPVKALNPLVIGP